MGLIVLTHLLICSRGELFIMKQFRDLSYQDLNSWVGQQTASRGRSYQRYAPVNHPVRDLLLEMAIDGNDPKEVFQWYTPNPGRLIHSPRENLTVMNIYHFYSV
jgi:uncharacterized Zn finger protein